MYSPLPPVRRHRPATTTVAMALISLTGWALCPETAEAQKARYVIKTMEVLGSFAKGIITGVVVGRTVNILEAQEQAARTNTEPPSKFRFTLRWQYKTDTLPYVGTLVMVGKSGSFRVRTPVGTVIDQDMTADYDGEELWLRGSRPRYAPFSAMPEGYEYYVDSFRLLQVADGGWIIADTCDAKRCAPVRVVQASQRLAAR